MGHRWQPDYIPKAQKQVEDEITRIEQERDAYESFHNRIACLQPTATTTSPTTIQPTSLENHSSNSQLKEIREIYRETVMQVPHISEEKTFTESVTAEFPDMIAEVLLTGDLLIQPVYVNLRNEAQESVEVRESFLTVLTQEATRLKETKQTLTHIGNEVLELRAKQMVANQKSDETRARLNKLLDQCDELATKRQAVLHNDHVTGDRRFNMENSRDYLYGSLSVQHPMLADIAVLGEFIQRTLNDRVDEDH